MITSLSEKLHKDTKIVASARFNKSKRLMSKTWWSLFSISSLSIALILLTICENTNGIKSIEPILFINFSLPSWIYTTLSSIIILALSIAISSARLDVEYEKLNDSAIRINAMSRNIEAQIGLEDLENERYSKLLSSYQKIISDNPVNHDNIDYLIAKAEINKSIDYKYYVRKYIKQIVTLIPFYFISLSSFCVVFSMLKKVVL